MTTYRLVFFAQGEQANRPFDLLNPIAILTSYITIFMYAHVYCYRHYPFSIQKVLEPILIP